MGGFVEFPKVVKLKQKFDSTKVKDIPKTISEELQSSNVCTLLKPGDSVAITAGSRGVTNIATIIRSLVFELKKRGARPFIIPAMGSHGGGTAEGQLNVLQHYGITENSMGVPIRSTMETIQIGETLEKIPVFVEQNAFEADHIAVVNRIKPHTDFDGDIESGITKMMAIGLGKHRGATHYHRANNKYGYYRVLTQVAEVVKANCSILLGLGIVENGYEKTSLIQAMASHEILEKERNLLKIAKSNLARIPFAEADVLIVNRMGKNISGTGMDTNVIGRRARLREPMENAPQYSRIFVRDLTQESYGNATGIGMADIVTRRLVEKIDFKPTYVNAITSTTLEGVRIPVTFDSDFEALEVAVSTSGAGSGEDCRMIWVKDTLELDYLVVSESLLDEISENSHLEIVDEFHNLNFDSNGNLKSLF